MSGETATSNVDKSLEFGKEMVATLPPSKSAMSFCEQKERTFVSESDLSAVRCRDTAVQHMTFTFLNSNFTRGALFGVAIGTGSSLVGFLATHAQQRHLVVVVVIRLLLGFGFPLFLQGQHIELLLLLNKERERELRVIEQREKEKVQVWNTRSFVSVVRCASCHGAPRWSFLSAIRNGESRMMFFKRINTPKRFGFDLT